MTRLNIFQWFELLFILYFLFLHVWYILLNTIASVTISRYVKVHDMDMLPQKLADISIPVSVLVPAYNEGITIVSSIRAVLQLEYDGYEVVVINDGSSDDTLECLINEFDLVAFPEAYRVRLKTAKIVSIYRSKKYPNLRVIDKENGGKADALNAGINVSRYPLYCGVDADSVLQADSLNRIVQPFLENPRTVASGGTVRIANGCEVKQGYLVKAGLPKNILALFQVVEYLRAFLFGRLGWSPLNALLIISGAFGVFHKETVIAVGGYRSDTIGEDMELIVRMHRKLRQQGKPYRIYFVPDPICWTEAPEDLKTLANQRVRWQRGLAESLTKNMSLMFHPKGGAVGWMAFPFMFLFEFLGPLIEATGYIFFIVGLAVGYVSTEGSLAFFILAVGFGILVSVIALMLEELSYRVYPKPTTILVLFCMAILENFGYRQLNTWWRLKGWFMWALGKKQNWGTMKRNASWSSTNEEKQELP